MTGSAAQTMKTRQIVRSGCLIGLVLAFATFLHWYGGRGPALTAAEGKAFLDQVRMSSAGVDHPEVVAAAASLIAHDDGREFYMVNFEQLRTGPEAVKQDRTYARAVLPALLQHGSMPVYVGRIEGLLLGRNESDFGRVAVVRYRSLRDFLVIFTDPSMQSGVDHKFASVAYTEARATSPILSLLAIRVTAACLFGLAALSVWICTRARGA